MAKKKRTRKVYSEKQRSTILATATKEGLTAAAVQKRFGVTPVTYYSWRRKAGAGSRSRGSRAGGRGLRDSQLRSAVQARLRKILPDLVRAEIDAYLDSALGSGGQRRQKGW
jgi:transposase-like protein